MGRFTMTYLGFASYPSSSWLSLFFVSDAQLWIAISSFLRCLP